MKLINNLNFNGRCREAFERYAEVLGGKLTAMHTFGEMPGNKVDAAWQDKIAHAWLQVGDQAIMGCDAPPEYSQPMGGFSVTLQAESTAEARRIFAALAEVTDFKGAVKAEAGEVIVFSWIEWPSKAVRDAGQKKMFEDPRMQDMKDMPFDGKRMIFGGFEILVDG